MLRSLEEYKERHLAFWSLADMERPLIGFTIGAGLDSWSYWQYNRGAQALLNRDTISPDDIHPQDFIDDQRTYLALSEQIDDDIIRTAMPLASIPWMEAILGCPVLSSEASMKSAPILENAASLKPDPFDPENPWVRKYLEFIGVYTKAFGNDYPVAQSVLRGPSDLASALLGAENATMALAMEPEALHRLLEHVTVHLEAFLRLQQAHLRAFHGGYVIGQYDIWASEPVIRIQEDFSVMYSPRFYETFLKPLDARLATLSNYTLIHLHAPSLFLIDYFLEIPQIRAFQVSKDAGATNLAEMIPPLQKIKQAGKPLIVKGQFDHRDIEQMKKNLSVEGLCIQPVVNDLAHAQAMLPELKKW